MTIAAMIAIIAQPSYGLTLITDRLLEPVKTDKRQVVFVRSLDAGAPSSSVPGFGLVRKGMIGLPEFGARLLKDLGLHSGLGVRSDSVAGGLQLVGSKESYAVELHYRGVPLCSGRLRLARTFANEVSLQGDIPVLDELDAVSQEWPGKDAVLAAAQAWGTANGYSIEDGIGRYERCYLARDGGLIAAAKATVYSAALPYKVLVSADRVESFQPGYFGVSGVIKGYITNPIDAAVNYSLVGNMIGDGTLHSTTFVTDVGDDVPIASSCEQKFDYPIDDQRFQEVNVFATATATLNYFYTKFGYSWNSQYGRGATQRAKTEPMVLAIHQEVGSPPTQNNALYQPAEDSEDGLPRIIIGDGDGVGLKNLPLDGDVVSHEFGHHIVYRSVTEYAQNSQSLILHEALADFFTFARTGNACLGESICPEGTRFCYQTSCLRSGETDLKWSDPQKPTLDHLEGQIISGMLWDIYKAGKIALDDLAAIVYHAIDYLAEDTSFTGFFAALITTDKERYASAYCQAIVDAIRGRGFDDRFLWGEIFQCGATLAPTTQRSQAALALTEENTGSDYILQETTDEAIALGLAATVTCPKSPQLATDLTATPCGTVAGAAPRGTLWSAIVLLLLPLAFLF